MVLFHCCYSFPLCRESDVFTVVRAWNRSAGATSLLLGGAVSIFVLMMIANVPLLGDPARSIEDAEFVPPNEIRYRSVMNTAVFVGFSYLLLWRSWRPKEHLDADVKFEYGINKSLRAIRVSYQDSNTRYTGANRNSASHMSYASRRGSTAAAAAAASRRGSAASTASMSSSVRPRVYNAPITYQTHHRRSSVPMEVIAQSSKKAPEKGPDGRRRFSVSAESTGIPSTSPALFSVPSDISASQSLFESRNTSLHVQQHRPTNSLSTTLCPPLYTGAKTAPLRRGSLGAYGSNLSPPSSHSLPARRGSTGAAVTRTSIAQALASDASKLHGGAGARPPDRRLPTLGERRTMERQGVVQNVNDATLSPASRSHSHNGPQWHGGHVHRRSIVHLLNLNSPEEVVMNSPSHSRRGSLASISRQRRDSTSSSHSHGSSSMNTSIASVESGSTRHRRSASHHDNFSTHGRHDSRNFSHTPIGVPSPSSHAGQCQPSSRDEMSLSRSVNSSNKRRDISLRVSPRMHAASVNMSPATTSHTRHQSLSYSTPMSSLSLRGAVATHTHVTPTFDRRRRTSLRATPRGGHASVDLDPAPLATTSSSRRQSLSNSTQMPSISLRDPASTRTHVPPTSNSRSWNVFRRKSAAPRVPENNQMVDRTPPGTCSARGRDSRRPSASVVRLMPVTDSACHSRRSSLSSASSRSYSRNSSTLSRASPSRAHTLGVTQRVRRNERHRRGASASDADSDVILFV